MFRAQPQSTALSRRGWTRSATIASFDGCDSFERDARDSVLDLLLRCSPRTDPRAMVLSFVSVRSSRVGGGGPDFEHLRALRTSRSERRSGRPELVMRVPLLHDVTEPHAALVACRSSSRRHSLGEKSERGNRHDRGLEPLQLATAGSIRDPASSISSDFGAGGFLRTTFPRPISTHGGVGVRLCLRSPEEALTRSLLSSGSAAPVVDSFPSLGVGAAAANLLTSTTTKPANSRSATFGPAYGASQSSVQEKNRGQCDFVIHSVSFISPTSCPQSDHRRYFRGKCWNLRSAIRVRTR
jgi:hypothetical protein